MDGSDLQHIHARIDALAARLARLERAQKVDSEDDPLRVEGGDEKVIQLPKDDAVMSRRRAAETGEAPQLPRPDVFRLLRTLGVEEKKPRV
jgi:hypothetical protein